MGSLAPARAENPASKPPIRVHYASGEVFTICQKAFQDYLQSIGEISRIPMSSRTVENTLQAFEHAHAQFQNQVLVFMELSKLSERNQTLAEECEQGKDSIPIEEANRHAIIVEESIRALKPASFAEKELQRLALHRLLEQGIRTAKKDQPAFMGYMKLLHAEQSEYLKNTYDESSPLELTATELEGVPADRLRPIRKNAFGNYLISSRPEELRVVSSFAHSSETRRRAHEFRYTRSKERNIWLLEKMLSYRQRLAKLYGAENWFQHKAAQTPFLEPAEIQSILYGKILELDAKRRAFDEELLKEKKTHLGLPPHAEARIEAWDRDYYARLLTDRISAITASEFRRYFPLERVLPRVLNRVGRLMGIEFQEVIAPIETWDPHVKVYSIVRGGKVQAHYYFDLLNRPGKPPGAQNTLLRASSAHPDGSIDPAIMVLELDLDSDSTHGHVLLSHHDIVALLHEIGHGINYAFSSEISFSAARIAVPYDATEIPAQLMEKWAWIPEFLSDLSSHIDDRDKRIPVEALKRALEIKRKKELYGEATSALLALLDLKTHQSQAPGIVEKTWKSMLAKLFDVDDPAEQARIAHWPHIAEGYDSVFYMYQLGDFFADLLFDSFQKRGYWNSLLGSKVFDEVYAADLSVPYLDRIDRFLNFEPSCEAWLENPIEDSAGSKPNKKDRAD